MKAVFIGDSLTYGYMVAEKEKWTYLLGDEWGITAVNKGALGDTTAGISLRFYEDVIEEKPDTVFIMGGTNDFLMGYSLLNVQTNLQQIIKEAQNYGIKVILGIQPPTIPSLAEKLWIDNIDYDKINSKIKALSKWVKENKDSLHIAYIDFFCEFAKIINNANLKEYYLDGIHLTPKGNLIMAKIAYNSLDNFSIF